MAQQRGTFGVDLDNDINRNRLSTGPRRLSTVTGFAKGISSRPSLAPNALPRPSLAPDALPRVGAPGTSRASIAPNSLAAMGGAPRQSDVYSVNSYALSRAGGSASGRL